MAKLIKSYKTFKIKETTKRDEATSKYWIILPSWDTIAPVWECDSIDECIGFIDTY